MDRTREKKMPHFRLPLPETDELDIRSAPTAHRALRTVPTQECSSASRMRNVEASQCHRGTDFSKTERSILLKAEWAADSRCVCVCVCVCVLQGIREVLFKFPKSFN